MFYNCAIYVNYYIYNCLTGITPLVKFIGSFSHLGLGWRIFHIITSEDIDAFTDVMLYPYINLICWCIMKTFSNIPRISFVRSFSNLRKCPRGLCIIFGESSRIFAKWLKIFIKSPGTLLSVCLYTK